MDNHIIVDRDGEEQGFTLDERAEYCAKTVIEHGGPRSFGGALIFQHHGSKLRHDPEGVNTLRKHGLTPEQIEYVLNFAIQA